MSKRSSLEDQILIFSMRNLMVEGELVRLERSGIELGHIKDVDIKDKLVDTDLFEHEILSKARKMADFYVLYYSLENSVRKLITDVLSEKYSVDWWEQKVPSGIMENEVRG